MRVLTRASMLARRDVRLGEVMEQLAAVHGDRRLAEDADGILRVTYRQAAKRVCRWAGGIAARTEPGDRVVIHTDNGYEQFLLCLAASRAGTIPVPINTQMRPDEVGHVIADSGAALVVRGAEDVDGAEPLATAVAATPGEVAALFYTSGTTGVPKGAALTHRALVEQVLAGLAWPAGLRRDEAVFCLPVAHIMGFAVLMALACAGVPAYTMAGFRPDRVLEAIEARRATVFIGVPAMYRMMLEAGADTYDLTSIRVWGSGADVMPEDLARRFKRLGATVSVPLLGSFGEAIFFEGYGMVEVGGGVATKISPPLLPVGLGHSVGFLSPAYRWKVVDDAGAEVATGGVGELWIKGPGVLKGYWNAPEATAEAITADGWLRTGDLVRRGLLGTVSFVGRQKDVIKHGGYSVYANEVQHALEQHEAVLEAAVLGLPDERMGELPVAVVRLAPGADLDALDLPAWLADHLAEYKRPRHYVAVDDLPRTGTRKVQKAHLLELFVDG